MTRKILALGQLVLEHGRLSAITPSVAIGTMCIMMRDQGSAVLGNVIMMSRIVGTVNALREGQTTGKWKQTVDHGAAMRKKDFGENVPGKVLIDALTELNSVSIA